MEQSRALNAYLLAHNTTPLLTVFNEMIMRIEKSPLCTVSAPGGRRRPEGAADG